MSNPFIFTFVLGITVGVCAVVLVRQWMTWTPEDRLTRDLRRAAVARREAMWWAQRRLHHD